MRAVSTCVLGTRATLSVVATTTGHRAPMKIRMRAGDSPMPNCTAARGSQAKRGTARRALVIGSSRSATHRDRPRPSPRTRPAPTARTQVDRQRSTLAEMWSQAAPLKGTIPERVTVFSPKKNASAALRTWRGEGRIDRGCNSCCQASCQPPSRSSGTTTPSRRRDRLRPDPAVAGVVMTPETAASGASGPSVVARRSPCSVTATGWAQTVQY